MVTPGAQRRVVVRALHALRMRQRAAEGARTTGCDGRGRCNERESVIDAFPSSTEGSIKRASSTVIDASQRQKSIAALVQLIGAPG